MFKFFLKLLCVTRTRIRILESGSVKNTSNKKRKRIPDPDEVRIRESYQTKGECLRIRILESGFEIFFYADPRFASDPYGTVRIHSSGSNRALLMCLQGYPASRPSLKYRLCYACDRTKCQPGPAGPPNPQAYHTRLPYSLTITVYGKRVW